MHNLTRMIRTGARYEVDRPLGFTLIELLVVITMIGFLAALLSPILARAKSGAHSICCVNNLRQIGVSFRLYTDDFRRFPAVQASQAGARSGFWDAQLVAQASVGPKSFYCPANPAASGSVEKNWSPDLPYPMSNGRPQPWPNLSYGYNGTGTAPDELPVSTESGLGFWGFGGEGPTGNGVGFIPTYVSESKLAAPADMIAVADYDPLKTDDDNDGDRHPELLFFGIDGRHDRGANVLFCDHHVDYNKTNGWTARTGTALRRWNYDHQPH